MGNSINDRIKLIRESKNMSQSAFSKFLGMGHSTLGMIEVGKRNILDRHIKTICSLCNINEEWLRYGKGEMYVETKHDFISSIAKKFNFDKKDMEILTMYSELPPEYRERFRLYLKSLVDTAYEEYKREHPDIDSNSVIDPEIEKEVEYYRRELEIEKRAEDESSATPEEKEA